MPKPRRNTYGEPITVDTMPEPVWGPRQWTDQAYDVGRPLAMNIHQAVYPLTTSYGLSLGVRVTLRIGHTMPEHNSDGTAEIFDGTQWHAVAGIAAPLLYSARGRYDEETDSVRRDMARLLEDVRLAHMLRAVGSDEIASRDRVMVTHAADAGPVFDLFGPGDTRPAPRVETMRAAWQKVKQAMFQGDSDEAVAFMEMDTLLGVDSSGHAMDPEEVLSDDEARRALLQNIGPGPGHD